ncbi:MFS transporter [Oceanicoccus sagamiensis]|nr:MFS transporter [Oceanicoccus sagamiensis]
MTDGVRIGPITLNNGITKRNALTFFYASFFTVGIISFMSFMQPYVLTENLNIPADEQGASTSILAFTYELVMLLLIAPFGALADKIGRRPIYCLGFLWVGVSLVIFPLAETMTQLVMGRMFFAVGAAAVTSMMATVLADYPQERSRGFMVAMSGIANGLGAVTLVIGMSQLPALFKSMGYSTLMSGRFTYAIAACLCVVTTIIVFRGLSTLKPSDGKKDKEDIRQLLKEGLQEARKNPRIAVACIEAFIARGDLMVVSVFFSLWANQAGLAQGMDLETAIKTAGSFLIIIQLTSLVWAPIWGIILDRVDRLTAVVIAMFLATIGYLWVGFSPSPIVAAFIPAAIMLGIGEFSAILAGITLVGQEAPKEIRGSVVGLFNFCGSFGILCISLVGGYVYDAWRPGAPFIVVGMINAIILVIALTVRLKVGYRPPVK